MQRKITTKSFSKKILLLAYMDRFFPFWGAKKYFFFKNSPTFTQILKCVSNTTPIKHLKRRAERRTKPSLSDPSDYSWGSKKKSEWKRKNSFICVIYQVFFTSSAHCLVRKSAHYHLFPKRWWNYHDNRKQFRGAPELSTSNNLSTSSFDIDFDSAHKTCSGFTILFVYINSFFVSHQNTHAPAQ